MALIAPLICRFAVNGRLNGQDCINLFDVRIDDDVVATRNDLIWGTAGDLLNQWHDHVLPLLVNTYQAVSVSWVDLDNAAGGTGSRQSTDEHVWPASASTIAPALPNHTYAKMVKNLEGKTRAQRNGALRLGGLAEGETIPGSPNTWETATRAALNAAFEDLKDGINGAEGLGSKNLVVVHTVNKQYSGYSEIASYSCDPTVGTIRRRMPGYGT